MRFALWAVVLAIELPLLLFIARILFGGWRGFLDACESLFVLDLSDALSGDMHERRGGGGGKFLLLLFVVFAMVSTMTVYYLVKTYFWGA